MTEIYDAAKLSLGSDGFSAFRYLSVVNSLLSNPVSTSLGRDLTIRALDARDKFTGHAGILRNMVRKAGLFPYLKKEFSELSQGDRIALDVYRTPFSEDFVFHSMQFRIFDLLKAGRNVVLSAPTSMGKSAIVDSLLGLGRFNRVVLVVPTVALADETRRRLQERFGEVYQIIHHSSQECRSERVVYVLTQERVNERDDIKAIDLFVIDEFYKLAFQQLKNGTTDFKDERVIELNIALSKLLKVSKQFYLTGPFINSIRGLTELGYDHTFISADFNTVAVDVQTFGVDANDDEGKLAMLATIAPQCEGATIIYCKSSSVAGKVARELVRLGYGQPFQSEHIDWVADEFDPEWDYTYALRNGIGLHFGGLPRALQQYTADRFNAGDLRFLLCTATIIEGVNTVAKNVVIYDNRNGTRGIDKFTHGNIKGRAGRMGIHFVGKVFCLEDVPEDNLNQEVDVPLGIQDADTPLNLLASAQPDHLFEYSQDRFEAAFAQDRFSIDLVKKHSFFRMEQFEQLYSMVEMLSEDDFESLVFHWSPAPGFLTTLATICSKLVPRAFSTNGLQTKTPDNILAKLTNYQKADSYSDYLKGQIEYTKQRIKDDEKRVRKGQKRNKADEKLTLSSGLNNDLKLVSNTFGYTIPKVLGLLEDVVRLHATKKGIRSTIDYSYVRMGFENLHLPPGVNALEEIGIPIQTLHRMSELLEFPEGAGVDELADYLRQNEQAWEFMGFVDQSFVKRALSNA